MIKSEKFSYIFKRLKDSILYFGAGVLALPISVFTSPLFAKNMSSYDFAAIGYFTALMQMILPILNLSFYSYFITDYFKRDEAENKKVLVSLVSFLILSNIVFIVIGYSGLYLYLNFSESSFSAFPLGLITILTGAFGIGQAYWLLILRFKRKSTRYFMISATFLICNFGLGILFVVFFKMGALGKLLPAVLLQAIIFLIFFFTHIKTIKIDFKIVKYAFSFCLPIIFSALLNLPILGFDRILIERLKDIKEFALYNIGFAYSGYLYSFGAAVLMAIEPDIYKLTGDRNKKKLILLFLSFIGILFLVDISFIAVSGPVINFLTAGRYLGAAKYANMTVFLQSMILMVYFLGYILTALKLTRLEFIISIIIAVTSIGLLMFFISYFKFTGAIYAKYLIYSVWILLSFFAIYYRNSKVVKWFQIRNA